MTNKQIMDAQKILRRLDSTAVRVSQKDGDVFWQVTYDNKTYNDLLNVVTAVARTPIKEYTPIQPVRDTVYESIIDYHRDKI